MDQYERLSQGLPDDRRRRRRSPRGALTPQQRAQVKRTFGSPRFEAAVADDDTVRQLLSPPSSRPRRPTATPRAASPAAASSTRSTTPPSASRARSPRRRTRSRSRTSPASCSASSAKRGLAQPDRRQVEPVRRRVRPASARGPALEQRREVLDRAAAPVATSSIVPTSTRFMWRMNVSASMRNSSDARRPCSQRGAEDVALEALVVGLGGREGGEVVRARAAAPRRRAAPPRRAVRPPQRAAALERRRRVAREHAVDVGARARVVAGGEAVRRPPRRRSTAISRGSTRVDRAQARQRALVGDDLPERVDAAVGAAGDRQRDRRRAAPCASAALELARRRSARPAGRPSRRTVPPSYSTERCSSHLALGSAQTSSR